MGVSTIPLFNKLLNLLITYPPVLNSDSDATVEVGVASKSCTAYESVGYFGVFVIHPLRIMKLSF